MTAAAVSRRLPGLMFLSVVAPLSSRTMARLFDDDGPGSEAVGYVRVALERSIDTAEGGLTYAVPRRLADVAVGRRVRVPLGRGDKPAFGYVIERMAETGIEAGRVKPLASAEPAGLSLPADLVELARWIAGYYVCPLGMVFASMLPAAVKRGTGTTTRRQVRRVNAAETADADPSAESSKPVTALQQAVLEAAESTGWVDIKALADRAGAKTAGPIMALVKRGLLESRDAEVVVSDLDLRAQRVTGLPGRVELMPAQALAVKRMTAALSEGFSVHLLHGVTGSGKTEVYLRVIEAMLAEGIGDQGSRIRGNSHAAARTPNPEPRTPPQAAIVLVPEIALTPQTVGRFLSRFGDDAAGVAVLHSGLTAAQRHAQWRRIRRGEVRIAVGARSAVFAPFPLGSLKLIVVDEEHESSYKQDQLPRYHARDVAIRRAQLAGCPVILGSATPSLESAWNAGIRDQGSGIGGSESGGARSPNPEPRTPKYHLLPLPDRIPGATMPRVELVDLVEERRQRRGVHLLSQRLETALSNNLAAGGQAIVLLNRRGYANYIACPDHRCGWMMRCDHCDATMVYHRHAANPAGGVLRCHHCLAEQLLPATCPDSGHKVSVFGLGTQRVEEELHAKFPKARVARMDADVMRKAADYRRTLDAFARGETDLLLGTQMIAKGLDVANVRLVGVVSGDTSLNFPDFRAAERTFQLIAQVAGRAGRGEHLGRVIVQTFNPDDPTIRLAAKHDYLGFATRELALRAEVGLPPIGRMARIVLRDTDHLANVQRAHTLAQQLQEANARLDLHVRLRGPAPCPIARIADHHRLQIELISPPPHGAAALQQLLTDCRNRHHLTSDTHTAIDVDPVSLL